MNDIRRTILWVIFGFSMVLLWDQWQVHNGQKATFFPSTTAKVAAPVAPASSVPAGGAVPAAAPAGALPTAAATAGAAAVPGGASTAPAATRERLTVNTDVYTLVFDTEGGTLIRSTLNKYRSEDNKTEGFVLLDESANRIYLAQTGLVAGATGGSFPTHKTVMTAVPGERSLKDGQNELQVKFESPDVGGVKLVKTYTLKRGAYDVAVRHDIVNTGSVPVAPQLYLQLVRDGNKPPGESSFYSTFTGPATYTAEKKYHKVEFKKVKESKADIDQQTSDGYIAMVQHYFASAWILPNGIKRNFSMDAVDIGAQMPDCCYRVTMVSPLEPIQPRATK
jgi:YidC/Oxa1 family membrane protein insertase